MVTPPLPPSPYPNPLINSLHSCGVPLFANATAAKCKNCDSIVPLRINPRLVGTLTDETGSILPGKLLWSDEAWQQLLGRTTEQLAAASSQVLKYLEHRLLFLRVHLMFGWSEEAGKLSVLRVQMS